MSKIKFSIFLIVLALFFLPGIVAAKNSIEAAIQKYGVTFPIKELGGCTDFDSCRTYCENQANRNACISFAKDKGFYKQDEINQKKDDIIDAAQSELGCTSISTCQSFCENQANFERCTEFAKKYNLGGGQILSPRNQEILSKAKSILGCDSPSSCKALCDKQENRERCKNFMQAAGLEIKGGPPEGSPETGPGGCNSQESCDAYCSDPAHRNECAGFGGGVAPTPPCQGEDECREFCIKNPSECPGFQAPEYLPGEESCKDPESCKGILYPEGGEIGIPEHCLENPSECPDYQPPAPSVEGIQTVRSYFDILKSFLLSLF